MNNDTLQITLNILGTEFKLYIERSEEAYYRRAEREINKIHSIKMDIYEVIIYNTGLCTFSFFLYFLC